MRMRLLVFVAIMLAALSPFSSVASTSATGEVMSGHTTALSTNADGDGTSSMTGTTCANLTDVNFYDALNGVVVANPAVFGFAGADPTEVHASANYVSTFAHQRIFSVYMEAYSGPDIEDMRANEFEWWGTAALTCLPDGRAQFKFKPSGDAYQVGAVEGTMGNSARVTITFDLTGGGAFSFSIIGPVVLHPGS